MKIDIKQHVTDTIIAEIEAGTPPWRRPWTGGKTGASFPLRHNGELYRGINILMLWAVASRDGYTSARWMTFKQAQALGGCVRKGSRATRSVFYGTFERQNDDQSGDAPETFQSRYAKVNNVFNADQIDGLPDEYYIHPDPPRDLGTQSDPSLDAFFAATGAEIITTEDPKAYYDPVKDIIHMPPVATFLDAARFYGTQSHELMHWVLSETRLATQKTHASKTEYAIGELEAEIGAAFLSMQIGVEPDFAQSAAYIEGWLSALKDNKEIIFRAAANAQKGIDHINDLVAKARAGNAIEVAA